MLSPHGRRQSAKRQGNQVAQWVVKHLRQEAVLLFNMLVGRARGNPPLKKQVVQQVIWVQSPVSASRSDRGTTVLHPWPQEARGTVGP